MYAKIFQHNKVTNKIGFLYCFYNFFCYIGKISLYKQTMLRPQQDILFLQDLMKCLFRQPNLQKIRSEKGHFKKLLA